MGGPALAQVPTPNDFLNGLYSYYKLNEASGSPAFDSYSGRTLSGAGVGSAAGVIGTCRTYDGSSGSNGSSSFTLFAPGANHFFTTFWFRTNTLTYGYDASFIGRFNLPYAEWLVWWNRTTHAIRFSVSATGNTAATVDSTTTINDTSWHFCAAGWDGTNIKISIDGQPWNTAAFAGPVYNGHGSTFAIGSESGGNILNGAID